MWSMFRAIANQIGLSSIERVRIESTEEPTLIQHPLNPDFHIRVRPDPDWTERLGQVWNGTLVNSRQERVAIIAVPNGKLFIADANTPAQPVIVDVTPGDYEVVLTIAHQGDEATFDYEEDSSHIMVMLQNHADISRIVPLVDEQGDELGIVGYLFMLAGFDILAELAGNHAGQWSLKTSGLMHPELEDGTRGNLYGTTLATKGIGEATLFYGGHGRGDYPLYRLVDQNDETVGIMADFFVDNRPWSEEHDG